MVKTRSLLPIFLLVSLLGRGASSSQPAPEPLPIDALARTVWIEEFDLSPDGTLIAFKSARAGTYDIWTVATAGGEPAQLTRIAGREMAPRFSPDGTYIFFEVDHGGTNVRDLYRIPSGGGEPERLTDHPLDDSGPSWSAGRGEALLHDPDVLGPLARGDGSRHA